MSDEKTLERFRDKLDRELKSGLVSLILLYVIKLRGPDYGYSILRTIQQASGKRLAFKEGTVYPILQNLEKLGFVTSNWGGGSSGPPRKYYLITPLGSAALEQVLEDWTGLISSVQDVLTAVKQKEGTS